MLRFIWSTLGYGELKEPGDWQASPSPGTFAKFSQREFYPSIDWQRNGNFRGRENGYVYIPN